MTPRGDGLRILLITHFYPPEVGAPQRRFDAFVRRWRELGATVRVVTGLPHYPHGRRLDPPLQTRLSISRGEHGEIIERVPFLPIGGRGGPWKLLDQTVVAAGSTLVGSLAPRPDIVVSSIPGPPSLVTGALVAKRWGVPHVAEFRDAWPDLFYEGNTTELSVPKRIGTLMTGAQRRADVVVTIAREFAPVLERRGVAPERLHHVPNGIDPAVVPLLPPPNLAGPLRILYIGTHGISQGLDQAVRAIARLPQGTYECRFIGDGTEKRHIAALAQELGAQISFEAPVRGSALWHAYEWAHTCLAPLQPWASFRYTVPSKLYEIMAAGRHITAALTGEAAQLVENAGAGAVVPSGDEEALGTALLRLADNRDEVVVGEAPRKWVVENASYDILARRYLDILEATAR